MVTPGEHYQHYKGGMYEIISLARHSETHEKMVVYRSLTEPELTWVRPYEMFTEDLPQTETPRFRLIAN